MQCGAQKYAASQLSSHIIVAIAWSHFQMAKMAPRQGSIVDEQNLHVTTVLTKRHEHAVLEENATVDDATLGALGYKQEFKRQAS